MYKFKASFAFFLIPIPFASLSALLGFVALFKQNLILKNPVFKASILCVLSLISLTLIVNYQKSINLSYSELKRLLALLFAIGNLSYLIYLHKQSEDITKDVTPRDISQYVLFGYLMGTKVWWHLPEEYVGYSWFKYVGGAPLFAFLIQYISNKRINKVAIFIIVLLFSYYGIMANAKGLAIFSLVVGILLLSRQSSEKSMDFIRYLKLILFVYLFPIFFLVFGSKGYLGSLIKARTSQYGSNLIDQVTNSRPELGVSLEIVKHVGFFGIGTPGGNQFHLASRYDFGEFSTGFRLNLMNRILGEGVNMHSWAFDLLIRNGVFSLILIVPFAYISVKLIQSKNLLSLHPGLYFLNMLNLYNLFFSPYSWFSSIDIAISLYAFYLIRSERNRDAYSEHRHD